MVRLYPWENDNEKGKQNHENLYPNLKHGFAFCVAGTGAKERGIWSNTKNMIDKGSEYIIEEIKKSELRGLSLIHI